MDFTRYRYGLCTVVYTGTKTTKFLLKFYNRKVYEKSFPTPGRTSLHDKTSRFSFQEKFLRNLRFLVNGSKCIRFLQNVIPSQTLRRATGARFCRMELETDSKSPERFILFVWNKIKLYWGLQS